ncbi:MAG: sigma-70 family RNA polymerase sigma factor [Actinobacteria bacterium]|nr:sigma-70 family RNA polymerase sigma factor [Actinomycetota bacterium]
MLDAETTSRTTATHQPAPDRHTGPDERALLAMLRAGDEEAFRRLLAELGPVMLRVAGTYVRDKQVAAEIVQETWIAVLGGLDGFQGRSSLRNWIFTILGNCASRRAQSETRSAPVSSLQGAGDDELNRFFEANHPRWASCWTTINTRWDALPENALTTAEAQAAITEKLKALPPTQCAVITLRDLEGWSSEEVCTMLGLTPENQRVLLHRARLALRRAFEEVLDDERIAS